MEHVKTTPRVMKSRVRQAVGRQKPVLLLGPHQWSDAPAERDTRHLQTFLSEYSKAHEGVVVCRTPRRFKLAPNITAVPWQEIPRLAESLT